MKFIGFYPETVVARVRATSAPPRVPTLSESLGIGAGGFGLIAVVVFAIIAATHKWLGRHFGEAGAYTVYALILILFGAGLFQRLVIKPAPLFRFYILFAVAFLLYSAGWMTAWMPLHNRLGEWLGSLLATIALGLTFATAFDAPKQLVRVTAVLFMTRSSGYFFGEFLHHTIPGIAGWLLWGACYGMGLGVGLGYTLYACQEPARQRLGQILRTGRA